MSEVALLNTNEDAKASKAMIATVQNRIDRLTGELTTTVLDRENYLLKIGASQHLKGLLKEMQMEYDRNFKV